jgi:hypothetical protein
VRSRLLPAVVGLSVLALLGTGCRSEGEQTVAVPQPSAVQQPTDTPVVEPSLAESPSAEPSPSASPSPTKPPPPPYDVMAVQTQLKDLG